MSDLTPTRSLLIALTDEDGSSVTLEPGGE